DDADVWNRDSAHAQHGGLHPFFSPHHCCPTRASDLTGQHEQAHCACSCRRRAIARSIIPRRAIIAPIIIPTNSSPTALRRLRKRMNRVSLSVISARPSGTAMTMPPPPTPPASPSCPSLAGPRPLPPPKL